MARTTEKTYPDKIIIHNHVIKERRRRHCKTCRKLFAYYVYPKHKCIGVAK